MAERELITIIAASGKQASHLLPHLAKDSRFKLRLVVNSHKSAERMASAYPDAETIRADLTQPNDCKELMRGTTTVYHVGPPMHAHETQIGYNMIDAAVAEAKNGHFKHFIYSAVMNTQLRKLMNHDCKRYVEEYLFESGLNYTILNPTNTLESLPIAQWLKDDKPVWKSIHNPECDNSLLALRDLGEATAKVIMEREKHYFAKYDCASTTPTPYTQAVPRIGKVIGKDIQIEWLPYLEGVKARWEGGLGGENASQGVKDVVERLIVFSNDHAVKGNPNVLRGLLGRETTSIEEWAKLQMQ